MAQYILVIDCNNFFVSCERLFRPDLAETPVLVLSSNDGCVVARSQEVKDMGISMGVPLFQIKDSLKDKHVTVFSGNHQLYRNLSRRVMRVIEAEGYTCEQYSIDEAFIIREADSRDELVAYARSLRAKIRQWVGIPVSIGIGFSKTQAKLANDYAKRSPDGVFLIDEAWCLTEGATLSVGTIWGIGARLAERYRRFGLATIADVMGAPSAMLRTIGGVVALQQQAELKNQVAYRVGAGHGPQKSMMSSQTMGQATTEVAVLLDAAAYHANKIARELQKKQLVTKTFHLYLRPKDRDYHGVRWFPIHLETGTNGSATILQAVTAEVKTAFVPGQVYNKVGVLAVHTVPAVGPQQPPLFGAPTPSASGQLDAILTFVEQRSNHRKLHLGQFTRVPVWRAKQASASPAYVTHWADLPVVASSLSSGTNPRKDKRT